MTATAGINFCSLSHQESFVFCGLLLSFTDENNSPCSCLVLCPFPSPVFPLCSLVPRPFPLRFRIQYAIKNWRRKWPGNEATHCTTTSRLVSFPGSPHCWHVIQVWVRGHHCGCCTSTYPSCMDHRTRNHFLPHD